MTEVQPNFHPVELQPKKKRSFFSKLIKLSFWLLLFALAATAVMYWHITKLSGAPTDFPVNTAITIEQGTEVREITEILANENVVQSDALLYYVLVLFYDSTDIKASTYVFEQPLTVREVATRLTQGDFDTNLIRFTHFEGERATQIATNAGELLPNFNTERFITAAEPQEGKLWPETYFVPADYTDEELLTLMLETYDENITTLTEQISTHALTLDEILVLASIIEREANTKESKETVASVLQNRLDIGMALQADASIEYVLDKPLSELTPDDLEIDSPYNTYLYPGLPPTPIGNPGLDAINAVLNPTESEYFYYITDDEGVFHYSETYNQHLRNIEKYLR